MAVLRKMTALLAKLHSIDLHACEMILNPLEKFVLQSITRVTPTFFLSGGITREGKYGREENAFRKSSARRSCSC